MKKINREQGFLGIIFDTFKTDQEKRKRGDDLGIFLYISAWFFIISIFLFSTDIIVNQINFFYLFFDFLAIFFIIIYIANKKFKKEEQLFKFPNLEITMQGIFFVIIMFLFALISNYLLTPFFIDSSLANISFVEIFELFRIVPVEELVFRGLGIYLVIFILSSIFNSENDQIKNRRIWIIAIFITGIMFGAYHIPSYITSDFPYFFAEIDGNITKIHIILPILYLSILGILLGFCRMKYGLFASILLHLINNISGNTILILILFFSSMFILIIKEDNDD